MFLELTNGSRASKQILGVGEKGLLLSTLKIEGSYLENRGNRLGNFRI